MAAPEVGSEARKSRVVAALDSSVFKRALYRAVVLQPLILAVVAGVLLWKIDRVLAAFGWAEPTSAVIDQAHRVRELFVNMEFGLRGFLTSGDADLFTRYREAGTQAPDALLELGRRIAVNTLPGQEKALAQLDVTYPAWREVANALVAARQCSEDEAGTAAYAASLAESMKGSIRSLLDSELAVQAERMNDRREAARLAIGLALFSTVLVGIGLALFARRQLFSVSRSYQLALDDQQRKTEELRVATARAEAANRAKDDFLATVSHELRTPLNTMLTAAELLKSPDLEADRVRLAGDLIQRNVRNQARLIDDLLDVSRIVSGKLTLDTTLLDLGLIVKEAIQGVRPVAESGQIALDASIPRQRLHVIGDYGRLLQVFSNVLTNAVKFTPTEGRVAVSVVDGGDEAEIRIADTGVGIVAEMLPRIFDRFEQADHSTTRRFGGLGLGLAIARHLVTMHRGSIEAESAGVNCGTTIRIRLPLADEAALAESIADSRGSGDGDKPRSLTGRRLLVVEDDRDAREALTMLLAIHGASVESAASVVEAFAKLEDFPVDLVLTDIAMPGEDGYALLRRLRSRDAERGHWTPVIAVTAMASAADRDRLLDAGFALYVTKPIDSADLIGAVVSMTPRERPTLP